MQYKYKIEGRVLNEIEEVSLLIYKNALDVMLEFIRTLEDDKANTKNITLFELQRYIAEKLEDDKLHNTNSRKIDMMAKHIQTKPNRYYWWSSYHLKVNYTQRSPLKT